MGCVPIRQPLADVTDVTDVSAAEPRETNKVSDLPAAGETIAESGGSPTARRSESPKSHRFLPKLGTVRPEELMNLVIAPVPVDELVSPGAHERE